MRRTKKVEAGLHKFLLVEVATGDGKYDYYVELAGRGGLNLSFNELNRLSIEANKFKRREDDADQL